MEKKKVGFASGIGFILAAAGSAVGLGNLWGFPYKTSQNGDASLRFATSQGACQTPITSRPNPSIFIVQDIAGKFSFRTKG